MGTSHSSQKETSSGQSSKLLFHPVHGENIKLSSNRSFAIRTNSFCKGITFSDRPVRVNEKVWIKFAEVSTSWSGVLRFGFSSHDPNLFRSGLPRYACPDLSSRIGFWAKAFSEFHVNKNDILSYYVNPGGDVHFQINGQEKGVFFSGVDVRNPLWALIDVYGNTTILELVDASAYLNNTVCAQEIRLVAIQYDAFTEDNIPVRPDYLSDLKFHRSKGDHVLLDTTSTVAMRRSHEYCNGYVFTSRPIYVKEIIMIKIMNIDTEFVSSMAFGVTSCDPQTIGLNELPDDSNLLLDRPEYWVVKKDLASNTFTGSVILFWISVDGEVFLTKDNDEPCIIMHVDNSVPLWAFIDIYGTTQKILLGGSMCCGTYETRREYDRFNGPCTSNGNSGRDFQALANSPSEVEYFQYGWRQDPSTGRSHFVVPPCFRSRVDSPLAPSSSSDDASLNNVQNLMQGASIAGTSSGSMQSSASSLLEGGIEIAPNSDETTNIIECVICCERQVDSVFYTCGHMCMCYQCSVDYWKNKGKSYCPMCRAPITDVIRTYK